MEMTTREQRRLLGQFVRAHRERIPPDSPTGRRRTPGLRREELAARAGIGTTWCAWIEQGRDVNASPHVLARLAEALTLTRAERAYLFELAGRRDPDTHWPEPPTDAPVSVRTLVEFLPQPSYGLDRAWNACCWNSYAERLFTDWLGKGRQKNLLRYMFVGIHPVSLSITHKSHADCCAELDIGQPREPTPHDGVAWRRIARARKIASELGNFREILPKHLARRPDSIF